MKFEQKTIDTLEYFKLHGISHEPKKIKNVLDYQDCIGRNNLEDIVLFCASLNATDRKTFFWANNHCLDLDLSVEIMARCLPGNIENAINKSDFEQQNEIIYAQKEEIKRLKDENRKLNTAVERLKDRAHKYDSIKSLLS